MAEVASASPAISKPRIPDVGDALGGGRFRLLRRLGVGGMGHVFEAFDSERQAHVALKLLFLPGAEQVLRFKAEFRAIQGLHHTNLVRLHELFEDGGRWFFTMELLEGTDFRTFVSLQTEDESPSAQAEGSSTMLTRAASMPNAPALFSAPTRSQDISCEPTRIESSDRSLRGDTLLERTSSRERPLLKKKGLARHDERRLKLALLQLTRGLMMLHGLGKVHRDIKPSNVIVNELGRLVVLDFGVISDAALDSIWSKPYVVGTSGFMAPEQARGERVGPAADWYAVGVLLYLSVTGRTPFQGRPSDVLHQKQSVAPPPPSELVDGVSPELDELIVSLLLSAAEERADGTDILRFLEVRYAAERRRSITTDGLFVGRQSELSELRVAFEGVRNGRSAMVLVEGDSGIGKTALVQHFLAEVRRTEPNTIVLAGRCYEREYVPYKAIDGVMDVLSRVLLGLDPVRLDAVLPERPGLLAQAFPVLRRVPGISEARAPGEADAQALREGLFSQTRTLLRHLASRWRLILVIDDIHWTDADSVSLLEEVMRVPDEPPLLLIGTSRRLEEGGGAARLGRLAPLVRTLPVTRLAPKDACALAERVAPRALAGRVAEEAEGHPLFISQLAHALGNPETTPAEAGAIALEDVLWRRIRRFEPKTLQILELVSVAGRPLSLDVLMAAAGVDYVELERSIAFLLANKLVQSVGEVPREALSAYHDRIRVAVTRHLDDASLRAVHARLARALETWDLSDLEAVAYHFAAALEPERAARYARLAADEAIEQLALDRAIRMYRLALELTPTDHAARELRKRMAATLAAAGFATEAAAEYERAAQAAPREQALALRTRAFEQLLFSGQFDRGIAILSSVVEAIGWRLPRSPRAALFSLVIGRARLALTRILGRRKSRLPPSDARCLEIDVGFSAAASLALVDAIPASDFHVRSLRLAIEANEPFRLARALAAEAVFFAAFGPSRDRRVQAILGRAREIARVRGETYLLVLLDAIEGLTLFIQGRWAEAHRHSVAIAPRLRASRLELTGVQDEDMLSWLSYEVDTARIFTLESMLFLGKLDEHRREYDDFAREALRRKNARLNSHLLSGVHALVSLAADEPDRAEANADIAIAPWLGRSPQLAHVLDLHARSLTDLYRGASRRALDRLERTIPILSRAQLLRPLFVRVALNGLLALTLVATAHEEPGQAKRHRARALRVARRLGREPSPWAKGVAKSVEALVAHAQGKTSTAVRALEGARAIFSDQDMNIAVLAVDRALGVLLGGEAGRRVVERVDEALLVLGVVSPARFCFVFCPISST